MAPIDTSVRRQMRASGTNPNSSRATPNPTTIGSADGDGR